MSSSSPLRLDLTASQCLSLELQFSLTLPEQVRRELALLGSREADQEDLVYFHEDYRSESGKLHSWAEVHLIDPGESEVVIEYLVESELEDQSELHHTDFTLSHLFDALAPIPEEVMVNFTARFDLAGGTAGRFTRLLPYNVGINGGHAVEYRSAHVQVKNLAGEGYDLWFDIRPDDTVEATLRFSMKARPAPEMPGHGLAYGREALTKLLSS